MARKNGLERPALVATVRRVLGGALFVGVMAVVVNGIQYKRVSLVQDISVTVVPLEGDHYLIRDTDVLSLLENSFTEPLTSMQLGELEVQRIEDVLERDPFVAGAEVYVNAQNEIEIELQQREPLLRVKDNNGQDYYLDYGGDKMPPSKHYAARVLVVNGNLTPWTDNYRELDQHMLKDVLQLARWLKEDEFLNALIEQVYINNKGEVVMAPKVGDQTIMLGRFDHEIPAKLKRLKIFYREGLPYEGWQKYSSFDLRFTDQVVAKSRE